MVGQVARIDAGGLRGPALRQARRRRVHGHVRGAGPRQQRARCCACSRTTWPPASRSCARGPRSTANRIGLMGISQARLDHAAGRRAVADVRFMVLVRRADGAGRDRDLLQRPGGGHVDGLRRAVGPAARVPGPARVRPAPDAGAPRTSRATGSWARRTAASPRARRSRSWPSSPRRTPLSAGACTRTRALHPARRLPRRRRSAVRRSFR